MTAAGVDVAALHIAVYPDRAQGIAGANWYPNALLEGAHLLGVEVQAPSRPLVMVSPAWPLP